VIRSVLLLAPIVCSLLSSPVGAQITAHRAPGALAPTMNVGCIGASGIDSNHTAADIAYGARSCAEREDFSGSADLVLIASAFAFFDTKRISDQTAHQALNALFAEAIGSLPEPLPASVFAEINALDGPESRKPGLCRTLENVGPPRYVPTYMLAHGMEALRGRPRAYKPPRGFKAEAAWKESLAFVGCS
jgi:hypothetical protein